MRRRRDLVAAIGNSIQGDLEAPFEIANLFPKHTGLPFVVWISYKGGAQHDVRVKAWPGPQAVPSQMAWVAIRPSVRLVEGKMSANDLALLAKWVELNRDVLVNYWEGDMDTKDAIEAIRPSNEASSW